ncbi:MAG: efflux RND transporter periplasmic adaptor subunit [Planctomycetes bacterium]|nr:efflux RND transporter periplasmic adaptor subunit [Planctomycetota bacterium]
MPTPKPPIIPVSHLVEREVSDFADYTGRTDAVQSVSIRARVTGFLMKMPFEEGAEVQEGDLLFEIDPRPYQALVDQAHSQVVLNQASYNLAKTIYDRDNSPRAAGVVSQLQLDQDKAAVDEADARIKAAQAMLDNAKLNLSYTQVRAPIRGQISRYYYTAGNLVTQDQTLLTTIVGMDYMYAYFDIEDRTSQRIKKVIDASDVTPPLSQPETHALMSVTGGLGWRVGASVLQRSNFPVFMATEGEEGFPRRGKLDFINNQVNPSTGTVAVRGVFRSVRPRGLSSLIPGMFVRVRFPLGDLHKAQLVIDRAIGSDQGLKFVYVVDGENKVQYRRVVTGALQEDGLRVIEPYKAGVGKEIETGVKPGEWVVVGGLQQLRPRLVIEPEQVAMPTLAGGDAPPPRRKQSGEKKQ